MVAITSIPPMATAALDEPVAAVGESLYGLVGQLNAVLEAQTLQGGEALCQFESGGVVEELDAVEVQVV